MNKINFQFWQRFLFFGLVICLNCQSGNKRETNPELYDALAGKITFFKGLDHMQTGTDLQLNDDGSITILSKLPFPTNMPHLFMKADDGRPVAWSISDAGDIKIRLDWGGPYVGKVPPGETTKIRNTLSIFVAENHFCSVPKSLAIAVLFDGSGNEDRRTRYFTRDLSAVRKACADQAKAARATQVMEISKKFGKKYAELIVDQRITIGMTKEMVLASLGEPTSINRTVTAYGVDEQWVYQERRLFLYFTGDKVRSFQD